MTCWDKQDVDERNARIRKAHANGTTEVCRRDRTPCRHVAGWKARASEEVDKGARWMPRLLQATKGAASCENPRGGASGL